jgi:signal transduction histidine kinase
MKLASLPGLQMTGKSPERSRAGSHLLPTSPGLRGSLAAARAIAAAPTCDAVIATLERTLSELLGARVLDSAAQGAARSGDDTPTRAILRVNVEWRGGALTELYVSRMATRPFGEEEHRLADFLATIAGAACEASIGNPARLRDIEHRLADAHRLASLGLFAARVSHQINNIAGILAGFVQLLSERAPDALSGTVLGAFSRQAQNCEQMAAMLRDFAATTEADLVGLPAGALLERALVCATPYASGREVRLEIAGLDEEMPGLRAHADELETALCELIKNAVDATPTGGVVSLSARYEVLDGHDGVQLVIHDGGKGLDPGAEAHLHGRWFTTRPGSGLGLGLIIARQIVAMHGGKLTLAHAVAAGGADTVLWLPA